MVEVWRELHCHTPYLLHKRQRQWRNNFTNKLFTFNNNGAIRWNLTPLAAFLPSLKSMSCSFPQPLLSDKKIHLNSHTKKELNAKSQASFQRAVENLFKDIGKPCQKLVSLSNFIGSMTTIDSHKGRN
jgi:hypothetical protein